MATNGKVMERIKKGKTILPVGWRHALEIRRM
jgi:hypothetical protein